jgi:alpha-L-rhamnosidase
MMKKKWALIIVFSFAGLFLFGNPTSERLQNAVIWTKENVQTAVFRKTIAVPTKKGPVRANIFADSFYGLYINGKFVMSGPSRFDPKRPEYDSLDITSFLQKGDNLIAVLVYGGISNGMRMKHAPGLALEIAGKGFSVITDNTWKCSGNTRFKQPQSKWNGINETIDAAAHPDDCLSPGFDDSGWETAQVVHGKLWGSFHPRSIPFLSQKEIQCLPMELPLTVNDTLTVRFNRNYLLTAEVEFETTAPCTIGIGGTKYIANPGTHKFRTFDPFGIKDAMLLLTTTAPVTLKGIRFFYPVYPFELKGSFKSSDSDLDRLWEMSLHTLQQVSEDGYQDCPWERAEWMGDAAIIEYPLTRVAFVSADGVYSDPRLIRKMIRDIAQSADSAGRIKAHHPSDRFDIHAYIEDYSCIWVQSLREYFEYTGDTAFVREMWPVAENLMDWFLDQRAESGLVNAREFIIFDNPLKYKVCQGATINAFTYKALKDAGFLAGVIENQVKAAFYNQSAAELRTTFNTLLWNDSLKLFNASTLDPPNYHSALLPLDRGIVDEDKRVLVENWLLGNYLQASKSLMTYTHFWLFEFLYAQDTGEWDKKAQDIMKLRYSKFYAPENVGFTVAEGFGGKRPFHNFGSSAAYFMSAHILGVKVNLPVSSNLLIIKPQLGYLTFAEGTVVTEHGLVDVKWEKATEGGQLKFETTIPQGKRAKVYLPVNQNGQILIINGKQQAYTREGNRIVFELDGGNHIGEVTYP